MCAYKEKRPAYLHNVKLRSYLRLEVENKNTRLSHESPTNYIKLNSRIHAQQISHNNDKITYTSSWVKQNHV